jgi:hypothetical protein
MDIIKEIHLKKIINKFKNLKLLKLTFQLFIVYLFILFAVMLGRIAYWLDKNSLPYITLSRPAQTDLKVLNLEHRIHYLENLLIKKGGKK